MTGPAPDGFSSWAEVPWSKIPARLREQPDHWPAPNNPSARRILWWRVSAVAGVVLTVAVVMYLLVDPFEGSVPRTGIRLVAFWAAVPLALIFGALSWQQAGRPHFERSWRFEELVRTTRPTRREMLRALRRGQHIPPESVPVTRFWIDHSRSGAGSPAWFGLICSVQMAVSSMQSSWLLAIWITYAALLLGAVAWCVRQEMSFRRWESRDDPEDGSGEAGPAPPETAS